MNKKIIIGVLTTLIVILTILGIIGLLQSKKEVTITNPEDYEITYKYNLDNNLVETMPTNSSDLEDEYRNMYSFINYDCTNYVEGTWDETTWSFLPIKTNDATCTIYFQTNYFDVDVTVENGELNIIDDLVDRKVSKGESIAFYVVPTEGYILSEIDCGNTAAQYDETTQTLTVENVEENTTCNISFQIDQYVVEFKANYGTLTESIKSASYGEEITTTITPAEDYVFNKVTCTEGQTATFDTSTNLLTVNKITSNATCTVDFTSVSYTAKLSLTNGIALESDQTEKKGSNVTFTLTANSGYTTDGASISCTNGQAGILNDNLFTITNLTANTTCSVTLKELETNDDTNDQVN